MDFTGLYFAYSFRTMAEFFLLTIDKSADELLSRFVLCPYSMCLQGFYFIRKELWKPSRSSKQSSQVKVRFKKSCKNV